MAYLGKQSEAHCSSVTATDKNPTVFVKTATPTWENLPHNAHIQYDNTHVSLHTQTVHKQLGTRVNTQDTVCTHTQSHTRTHRNEIACIKGFSLCGIFSTRTGSAAKYLSDLVTANMLS